MYKPTKVFPLLMAGIVLVLFSSCYKKDIQFGNDLGETYTKLLSVDTVSIDMSTVVADSFATNTMSQFLLGRYADTSLGVTTAKPFFQLTIPSDLAIEENAVYDSLTFVVKLNKYYYGDTTKGQTITVRELDAPIEYTYGNSLFNTSAIAEKPMPLGSSYMRIQPLRGDSIVVKLSDAKGAELFNKLKTSSEDVASWETFLNYFRGVSLSYGGADASALFGFDTSGDSVYMRLHYHTTIPLPEKHYKDFPFNGGMYFNQMLTDRSATQLAGAVGQIPSEQTGNHGYVQGANGTLLKLTFPSLRNILQLDPTVKLLRATLLLKVDKGTYDNTFRLPPVLYMAQTDATNTIGNFLSDSTGKELLYGSPIIDPIYSASPYYSFNVTSSVNSLLTTSGSEKYGFFVMETTPGGGTSMHRAVFNNSKTALENSKLVLSLLTLKN